MNDFLTPSEAGGKTDGITVLSRPIVYIRVNIRLILFDVTMRINALCVIVNFCLNKTRIVDYKEYLSFHSLYRKV